MPTVTQTQDRISDSCEVTATAPGEEVKDEEMEYELDEDWAKQIDNLITLSNLPSSRWQHLLKLDVIKVMTEVVASNLNTSI